MSFNRTSNIRITRLNLVYKIRTKQHSDCVFPSGLWEKVTVLRLQIAKQRLGFNPLSLIINKSCSYRKANFFLCNKRKMAVKPTIHQNSAVSIALLGKI